MPTKASGLAMKTKIAENGTPPGREVAAIPPEPKTQGGGGVSREKRKRELDFSFV